MSEIDIIIGIIGQLRVDIDGEVCSRSRVVDGLLDVRLAAGHRPDLVDLVDSALATVPGRNTVAAGWWREQLDSFELAAALDPAEPVG